MVRWRDALQGLDGHSSEQDFQKCRGCEPVARHTGPTDLNSFHHGKLVQKSVSILETDGSSLQQTLGQPGSQSLASLVTSAGVDVRLTISNHVSHPIELIHVVQVVEVFHTLGVEAARAVIIRELQIITAAYACISTAMIRSDAAGTDQLR